MTEIKWVYQNGNFLPGKSISRREKIWKNDFAPSEKYACCAPEGAPNAGPLLILQSRQGPPVIFAETGRLTVYGHLGAAAFLLKK